VIDRTSILIVKTIETALDPYNDQYFYTTATKDRRIKDVDLQDLKESRDIKMEDPNSRI